MNQLPVKLLSPNAKAPVYATRGAAGMDFYVPSDFETVRVHPAHSVVIKLGVAVEIPEGWAMLLMSRSGHGLNYDVSLANAVGLIDSDYRGELAVKVVCRHGDGMTIKAGDRICQGVLIQAPQFNIMAVDELGSTERGNGGFGSTDVDFMQEWCDKAPDEAMSVAVDSDGSVWGYGCDSIRIDEDTEERWRSAPEGNRDIFLIGDERFSKNLWRESKRVRTDKGWAKA